MTARHLFSVFDVTRQVFFETPLSLGIVNLKPLRPGHVLIISKRVVPRLSDLETHEVSDLFQSVQHVGRAVERAYNAEALNIAVQDGSSAGQSVPHVHVHIIPRHDAGHDFGEDTDQVYPALEASERNLESDMVEHAAAKALGGAEGVIAAERARKRKVEGWQVPRDEERRPRTLEEMEREASWLASMVAAS